MSDAQPAIAHYNLLDRIGTSALGEVYRARDTKVGRTVALKLAPDAVFTATAGRDVFLEDARAAAALSHPNIATLFDVGEYAGGCYLAYEFASGVTLRQEIAGRAVNPRRAVELAAQIADALADGHSRGVLHGDLRPDTILVTQKGSAKVLEFGMSRWTRGGHTRARAVLSPQSLGADVLPIVSYMSPEQALGADVDVRSDVFSLSVILCEMLTGRNPFAASTVGQTLLNVVSSEVPPCPVAAGVPADLERIVARGTAKAIDKRHQSAVTFSAELRRVEVVLDERAGHASPGDLPPLEEDRPGSGKWWAIAIGLVALAALSWWIAG